MRLDSDRLYHYYVTSCVKSEQSILIIWFSNFPLISSIFVFVQLPGKAPKWTYLDMGSQNIILPQRKSLLRQTSGLMDDGWKIFVKVIRNWRSFLPQKIRAFTVYLSSCHFAKIIINTVWQLISESKNPAMYTQYPSL